MTTLKGQYLPLKNLSFTSSPKFWKDSFVPHFKRKHWRWKGESFLAVKMAIKPPNLSIHIAQIVSGKNLLNVYANNTSQISLSTFVGVHWCSEDTNSHVATWILVDGPTSITYWPPSVAQPDTCPIGDHKVVGPIPAGSGNILSWRLITEYLYGYPHPTPPPLPLSKRTVVSLWRKIVHKYW